MSDEHPESPPAQKDRWRRVLRGLVGLPNALLRGLVGLPSALRELKDRVWNPTVGMTCFYWLVFDVLVGLAPIALALATSPLTDSVGIKLASVVGNGELFLISTTIAAPAFGRILSRESGLERVRGAIVASAFITTFFSIALFAQIATHHQEVRERQQASERVVASMLKKATDKNGDAAVLDMKLRAVDANEYLTSHASENQASRESSWPDPKVVARRSYWLLLAALGVGLGSVLFAEARS